MHVEPSTKIWQFDEEEEGDERMQLVPSTKVWYLEEDDEEGGLFICGFSNRR